MKKLLFIFLLFGCKKEPANQPDPKPTYTINYSFYCDTVPYYVAISEITNLHDFEDSIYTKSFTKTIIYNYNTTFRTRLEAKTPCYKKTTITHNGNSAICEDTLYSSLECFKNL